MPKQSKIQKIQTAKKTKYREKIRKIIILGLSLVLRKNCILKIQVQRGLYFTVFFQIQRAKVCIGMHSKNIRKIRPWFHNEQFGGATLGAKRRKEVPKRKEGLEVHSSCWHSLHYLAIER